LTIVPVAVDVSSAAVTAADPENMGDVKVPEASTVWFS
jgi:hypothetical protein